MYDVLLLMYGTSMMLHESNGSMYVSYDVLAWDIDVILVLRILISLYEERVC